MPSHKLRAGRVLLELLVTLLIGLTPVGCGLLIVVWQVDKQLEEAAEVALRETLHNADGILDEMHAASTNVINLTDFPCEKALPRLRTEVVLHPDLRSLVLVRENRAYCSTLHGESQIIVDPGNYFNQRLRLEPGNSVTPDSAVLYYRLQEYPVGVLALSDGKHLQAILDGIMAKVTLVMQFGDAYLWRNGIVAEDNLPNHQEQHVLAVSSKYGYTLHAGYPDGHTVKETIANVNQVLPSVLLVGMMTSAAAYWAMFRKGRRPILAPSRTG